MIKLIYLCEITHANNFGSLSARRAFSTYTEAHMWGLSKSNELATEALNDGETLVDYRHEVTSLDFRL